MLRLRKACKSDCDLLFQWANDKECRKNSFSTVQIPYDSHCQWLERRLNNENSDLFILEEETPIGMLRLDYEKGWAEISYSIAKEHRSRGYGKKLLILAEEFVRENRTETCLVAEVKKENVASRHLFLVLGYEEKEQEQCVEYTKQIVGG